MPQTCASVVDLGGVGWWVLGAGGRKSVGVWVWGSVGEEERVSGSGFPVAGPFSIRATNVQNLAFPQRLSCCDLGKLLDGSLLALNE